MGDVMTKDNILRLATECCIYNGDPGMFAKIERFAKAIARLERAECASICDDLHSGGLTGLGGEATAEDCAYEIRGRSDDD